MVQTEAARAALLNWYDGNARQLPWRGARDPYRIWVSEIMLQQTRAETVISYYEDFMRKWPDVLALADADIAGVLKMWEGLGYYSRARNLHAAAVVVAREMGGTFPKDAAGLRKLPGIGEYTAGMIASIAYGAVEPAIDGNQIRVLSRLFQMDEPARTKGGMARLKACALALLCQDRPGDVNQALMDIGRMICKPRRADCGACPLDAYCAARAAGVQHELPVLPERTKQRSERRGVAIVAAGGRVLLRRQPEKGLLGGLWLFPNYIDADSSGAVAEILAELGIAAAYTGERLDYDHVFTHLIWRQAGFGFTAETGPDVAGMVWVDLNGLNQLAIPAAHRPFRELAIQMIT